MQLKDQQKNYYKTLQDYASLIEATLKEQAPSFSGSLRDSITGEIEFDQNGTANVGIYMAEHGTYINEGVNGAKSSYIENKNTCHLIARETMFKLLKEFNREYN